MDTVSYSIKLNGNKRESVTGISFTRFLAIRYIENKGFVVDHLPSGLSASGVGFVDVATARFFASLYTKALGDVIKTKSQFVMPDNLRWLVRMLDRLEEYEKDKNSPITCDDLRMVISKMAQRKKP